jgi:hypothetical protein
MMKKRTKMFIDSFSVISPKKMDIKKISALALERIKSGVYCHNLSPLERAIIFQSSGDIKGLEKIPLRDLYRNLRGDFNKIKVKVIDDSHQKEGYITSNIFEGEDGYSVEVDYSGVKEIKSIDCLRLRGIF